MIGLIRHRLSIAIAILAIGLLAFSPLRGPAALVLLTVAPGWVLTRWLDDADLLYRLVLAVVISVSVTMLASLTLLYLGEWSWQRCLAAVVALTLVAAVVSPVPRIRERSLR